jgi:hypothetical protein
VAEQLLLCGKERCVTAIIVLVTVEKRSFFLILEGVIQHTVCKTDDRIDRNNHLVITFYQLQTQIYPFLFCLS